MLLQSVLRVTHARLITLQSHHATSPAREVHNFLLCVQAIAGIVACTYTTQCDGIFIGSLDFAHLPRTNLLATIFTVFLLWFGEKQGYGLVWVWWVMAFFFKARLAQHALHAIANCQTSAFGMYRRPQEQPGSDAVPNVARSTITDLD
jgi:hypothetical protein